MPELPEVECVRLSLSQSLAGKVLLACHIHHPKVFLAASPLKKGVFPLSVECLERHGKYLIMRLERGYRLVAHFRMTGCFYYREKNEACAAHTHIEFPLDTGNILCFRDPRRFGRIWLIGENEASPLEGLGPDALDIPEKVFISSLLQRNRRIKPLLLDQTVIAGMGNIYADESLFRARIHPETQSSLLKKKKLSALWKHSQEVLHEAIDRGGSSISDFVSPGGVIGTYQEEHGVYGREGLPCSCCGAIIQRIVVGQRGTHFCPRCQKPSH